MAIHEAPKTRRFDRLRVHQTHPLNAEAPPEELATPGPTPVDAFFVRSHGEVPRIDDETFTLTIDGMVDPPLVLRLDELKGGFLADTVPATLQCAGNRRT